jgi:type IV pilus assembly protein PilW
MNKTRSLGFSLVEIMVAMVIGMFGVLIMMQVLATSEDQKRTTTGGNDAMNEGLMALYAIQGDIRSAGYGLADMNLLGCSLILRMDPANPGGALELAALAPVTINPLRIDYLTGVLSPLITGQDPGTDTLLIAYGTGEVTTQGDSIQSTLTTALGTEAVLQTASEFAPEDFGIAAPPNRANNCNHLILTKVATRSTAAPISISLKYVDPSFNSIAFNPGAIAPQLVNPIAKGGRYFNLGRTFRLVGYAVRNNNLTTCDFGVTDCGAAINWVSIANNVISLNAQYGRDGAPAAPVAAVAPGGSMDGVVDLWDQKSANLYPPNSPAAYVLPLPAANRTDILAGCEWAKTSAIRLAVVARSEQMEKQSTPGNPVTPNPPTWIGVGNIDVSRDPNWNNYRYKVFQTSVPMRNILWPGKFVQPVKSAVALSC